MKPIEQKLIDYCDGTLKGEELSAFEEAMKKSPDLQKQVDQQKEILLYFYPVLF